MNSDKTIRWFTAFVAVGILVGTFYALVIYPYVLDSDVKLWLTSLSGVASLYLFGDQLQRSSSARTVAAYEKGLSTPVPPTPDGATATVGSDFTGTATIAAPPDVADDPAVEEERNA